MFGEGRGSVRDYTVYSPTEGIHAARRGSYTLSIFDTPKNVFERYHIFYFCPFGALYAGEPRGYRVSYCPKMKMAFWGTWGIVAKIIESMT